MENMYLCVGYSDETGEIVMGKSPTPDNNEDWVVKIGVEKFPMKIYDILFIGEEKVSIAGRMYDVNDIELQELSEFEGHVPDNDLVLKNSDAKFPDKNSDEWDKIGDFTKAVIEACIQNDRGLALSKEDHAAKLTIIRSINKLTDKNDITVKKAGQLLCYYGLSIKDVLNPEYVK